MKFKVGDRIQLNKGLAEKYITELRANSNRGMAAAVEQILTEGPVFTVNTLEGNWNGCFEALNKSQHININSSAWGGDFPGGIFVHVPFLKRKRKDGV